MKENGTLESKMMGRDSYPIPDIQENKWNQQEYCWPGVLASNDEDAEQCYVHGNGNTHKEGKKDINIGLISRCLLYGTELPSVS